MRSKLILIIFVTFILFLSQKSLADTETIDDLIVENGQTKIIEDQKLTIEGDIIVKSNGTLIIRNSDITINSHYKNQYWVLVHPGATLLMENTVFRDGPVPNLAEVGKFGEIENFRYGETVIQPENARVILRNTTSEPRIGPGDGATVILENSYLSILFWRSLESVTTTVTNSSIQMLHIWLHGEKEGDVELSGLGGGRKQSFHLSVESANLTIENSEVKQYSVALWSGYPHRDCRKNVLIQDSQLSEIFAVFPKGSNVKLWNMKPGFFENWSIKDNMNGSGVPWNLTLKNVSIDKWKLDFHDTAEIENSSFHLDTWDKAKVVVKNSTIVSNHHTRGGYIKFINSVISDRPWHFTGVRFLYDPHARPVDYQPIYVYEFENSTVGPYAELSITDDKINITFKGNLSLKITPGKVHWFGGTITREYNVIVFDEKQSPLSNQTVVLFDPSGKQIWEKSTDENGLIYFNLTFNKENYEDEFLLQTTIDDLKVSKEVSFFTDTPIPLSREKKIGDSQMLYLLLLIITLIFLIFLFRLHLKKNKHISLMNFQLTPQTFRQIHASTTLHQWSA